MAGLVATCDEELAHLSEAESVDWGLVDSWLDTRLLLSEEEKPAICEDSVALGA